MDINVAAKGFGNNRELIDQLTGNFDAQVQALLHKLGEDVVAVARHNIHQNGSIDTGTLLASLRILDETENYVIVGTDEPYAEYVEYGRGPITASPGKVLHFFLKDGTEVFTKSVKAAEPRPFLEPAVIQETKMFKDVYVELNSDIIRRRANNLLDIELL